MDARSAQTTCYITPVPEPSEEAEPPPKETDAEGEQDVDPEEYVRREVRRRGLGSLLGLLDSGARKGQDLVTEVAKGSKEEVVRVVSQEVRGFLDKMDVVDLAHQIISGLKVDAHVQIRFSRDEDGKVQPEVTKNDTKLTVADDDEEPPAEGDK